MSLAVAAESCSQHRKRLAVVISHPIQHFAPLFAALARESWLDLQVFFCCDWGVESYSDPGFGHTFKWDIPLLDGYQHEFLPIRTRPKDLGFRSIDNPAVGDRLAAFDPDAVWIHGYSHRSSWRAYRWAVRNRRRILYFGDSELLAPRGLGTRLAKRLVLPGFFRRCDAFLTIGDNNEAYYRHYGVPNSKMIRGAFPVDVGRFRETLRSMDEEDRRRERQRLGLNGDALVGLFIGKFIDIKRPLDLVHAVDRLRTAIPELQALMLGSGQLEGQVRAEIARLDLADRIVLPGFINQAEIPRALRLGDFLVMSSSVDPHPLAVTEAMAVGNAIVASDRVGCVGPTDAARPGENALVYPYGDFDALASCILDLARNSDRLCAMQQRSIELAESQDVSVMVRAVAAVLGR
jgi:glycosyltransferase involved in cell wall biosynthesis